MTELYELLKIIIPAGAVFAAAYFLVKRFLDNDQKRREFELKKATLGTITPLKIQAYERIVIFLERINPNSLVIRVNKNGMNSRQLHNELITAVKTEFEHNLSQQIYVSHGAWELVKNAKEEVVQLINEEENIIGVAKVKLSAADITAQISKKNITAAHADNIVIF